MGNICAALCVCQTCTRCCCPSNSSEQEDKNEPGSRIPYVFLFFVVAVLSIILRFWGGLTVNLFITSLKLCDTDKCVGYGAVYRLTFPLTLMYGIQSIVCKFYSKARQFDKNYWFFRILSLAALTVACWFIPNDFYEVYSHFARAAGAVYIFLQIVILIDAVIRVQEFLIERDLKWAILASSLACLGGSLTILIFLFKWFGGSGCGLENFFISFTIILTVCFLGLSVSSLSRHGVLPASIMCLYCYYIAFSALSSNEKNSCNRVGSTENAQVIVGMILTALSVTYSAYTLATGWGKEEANSVPLSPAEDDQPSSQADDALPPVLPGEKETIETSSEERSTLCRFHILLALAAMYMAMILTNWGSAKTPKTPNADVGHASMWVKIISQWCTALLYIWTFIAPKILTGRDFD